MSVLGGVEQTSDFGVDRSESEPKRSSMTIKLVQKLGLWRRGMGGVRQALHSLQAVVSLRRQYSRSIRSDPFTSAILRSIPRHRQVQHALVRSIGTREIQACCLKAGKSPVSRSCSICWIPAKSFPLANGVSPASRSAHFRWSSHDAFPVRMLGCSLHIVFVLAAHTGAGEMGR